MPLVHTYEGLGLQVTVTVTVAATVTATATAIQADPEIPDSRSPIPDLAGKQGGSPHSRLGRGRNRESGNPPFPESAGKRESGVGPDSDY